MRDRYDDCRIGSAALLFAAAALTLAMIAPIIVLALFDTKHAVHAADQSANDATHRGADDRADGTGNAIALVVALLGAPGNTLRLRTDRQSERDNKNEDGKRIHGTSSILVRSFAYHAVPDRNSRRRPSGSLQ
jgi:hypothetical protein